MKTFLQLLAPFAPHIWRKNFGRSCIPRSVKSRRRSTYAPWPKFDPALLVESEIEIPVQVNGKFRDVIKVAVDADNATHGSRRRKRRKKCKPFIAGKDDQESHHRARRSMVNLIVGVAAFGRKPPA